ncbi:MAG: hypothetical protein M3Z98_08370 [Candidatus Dormibacteraeota bacterium]|nr:hypothetical protein [Candidatus Dormibacteraeota bacterium]
MARVPLSKIELDEDEMIVEGFEGELEGIRVWVTAVLERTCVYETAELERKLVSKAKILVERDSVPIRRRKMGGPPGADQKGRGKPGPKPAAVKAAAEAAEAERLSDPLA